MSPEVRAEVKTILFYGAGASRDGASFEAPDTAHFGVRVQVLIGEPQDGIVDSFDLIVCSPSWFAAEVANGRWFTDSGPSGMPDSVAVGSGLWFMRRWDQEAFESAVSRVCDAYSPAPDWGSLAARIGRSIPWEADYRYDAHVNARYGSPFPPPRER